MAAGKPVTYANIETDNGHDGFLLPNQTYEALANTVDATGRSSMNRLDLNTVLGWVPRGSKVLDLGCGDGAFLKRLCEERGAVGVGVDIDPDNLVSAVSKGLDVIQEDINEGLNCFTRSRFDVVILTHALQELTHPHLSLRAYGTYWRRSDRLFS